MNKKFALLLLICLFATAGIYAQAPKPHASPEVRQRARDRADYGTFKRKIAELKEFSEERKKIPLLQKENKEAVKVYATVDSVETDDTTKAKTMTGYITQQIGESTANAYEVTYDRATKKITAVKRTGESVDPEAAEAKEKPASKKTDAKKAEVKKASPAKKKKDGDDEDGDEEEEKEEKPSKEKDE